MGVTLAWTFQLVAQRVSSKGDPTGSPVFQRKMPESCHPPRTACTARLSVFMRVLPLPNGICHTAETIDEVPDVEVGVAVVAALANRIFDKRSAIVCTAEAKVRLQTGRIIQRMGEAVIEVQSQAAEALSHRNRQSVVVGISNRAPRGQRTILWLHEPRG